MLTRETKDANDKPNRDWLEIAEIVLMMAACAVMAVACVAFGYVIVKGVMS